MINEEHTLLLKPIQYEYLQKMAKKYNLEDESKALRCLISFALQETQHESTIFEEIRCLNC